jgi:hypothetical protein
MIILLLAIYFKTIDRHSIFFLRYLLILDIAGRKLRTIGK